MSEQQSLTAVKSSRSGRVDGGRAPRGSSNLPAADNHKAVVKLRALKRKLNTLHQHAVTLIDETLDQLVA